MERGGGARKSVLSPDTKGNPPSWEGEEMKALGNARRKRRVWPGGGGWEGAPTHRVPAALGSPVGHHPWALTLGCQQHLQESHLSNPAVSSQALSRALSSAPVSSPGITCWLFEEGKQAAPQRWDLLGRAVPGWGSHTALGITSSTLGSHTTAQPCGTTVTSLSHPRLTTSSWHFRYQTHPEEPLQVFASHTRALPLLGRSSPAKLCTDLE